jgi:cysteine desulfurase/selenocysteine lyase
MQTLSLSETNSVYTPAIVACPLETSQVGEANDFSWIRSCFPLITNNPDKIFFDNAATSQKPYLVVEKINEFHAETCSNAGRGSYSWSTRLARAIEDSRTAVASLLNTSKDAIAFTSGATDSLNMVANYWRLHNLRDGDEIMVCPDDHRSAVMPWYNLKHVLERFGIGVHIVPFEIHSTGTYDRKSILKALSERTRLIALAHVHHLYGMEMDIAELKALIPDEVLISLDGSQKRRPYADRHGKSGSRLLLIFRT